MSWVAIVPVKGNPGAKSRLGGLPDRAGLADAFALDTVAALVAARGIERVFVVTGDVILAASLSALGADIVPEPGPESTADPLNAAIRTGIAAARAARPGAHLAVMTGDLPALTSTDVDRALMLAEAYDRSMVADAAGTGTTTLLARSGVAFDPRFGADSRAAHEAAGHVSLSLPDSAGIRRDVDTPADLVVASALGVGPHTAALLPGRAEA